MNSRILAAAFCMAACTGTFGPREPADALAAPRAAAERNDYANARFSQVLAAGLDDFYAERFVSAQAEFGRALRIAPTNSLAITFLDAAAAHRFGALDEVVNAAEDAVAADPKGYADHLHLGFAYLFSTRAGLDRRQDARDEFNAAVRLDPAAPGAHVGLGIMRFDERSPNRAKLEFLTALRRDPDDVLAREYLGQIYQTDLREPQRGLAYAIDIPNLVPHYADIYFHVGSLLYDLGQNGAAIDYLQRGIALDPRHVGEAGQHGYTLIARIEISAGQYADARKELTTALAADVDAIYARTLLEKVRGMSRTLSDKVRNNVHDEPRAEASAVPDAASSASPQPK